MSTTSIAVAATTAFKPVDIKMTVTTEVDLKALTTALRQGIISLPETNLFVADLTKKLQQI
jgi:hypothetical protein